MSAAAFPARPIEAPADFELVRKSEWAERVTEQGRLEEFEKDILSTAKHCASGRLALLANTLKNLDSKLNEPAAVDGRTVGDLLAEDVFSIARAFAHQERESRRIIALFTRYAALAEEPCPRCHGTNIDLGDIETHCEDSGRPFDLDQAIRIAEDNDAGECGSPTCVGGWEVGVKKQGEQITRDGLPAGMDW